MKCIFLIVLVTLITASRLPAQHFSVNLSPKHLRKLEACKSGHQKLKYYYKFYRNDSITTRKSLEKKYGNIPDSIYKLKRKQLRLHSRLMKNGKILPGDEDIFHNSIAGGIKHYNAILKNSSSGDSLKSLTKEDVKILALDTADRPPGFQYSMDRTQISRDSVSWEEMARQVPGMDTLAGIFDSPPSRLKDIVEKQSSEALLDTAGVGGVARQLPEAVQLKGLPQQYKQQFEQYEQYTDKGKIERDGKEKMVNEAVDYFSAHVSELKAAQDKLSRLMTKYREIPNSDDLSTAIKRTSMKGKSLREHLVIGGNFNVVSTSPVSLDLSPLLGYKFTTNLSVGIGMRYRCTFGDSIRNNWYVSSNHSSFKTTFTYDVTHGFFATAEWETTRISLKSNDITTRVWKGNVFLGAGKRVLVHPGLYLTTTAFYNLNSEDKNPVEPRRFKITLGFQLSELAIRKKKISYDPNR